MKKIILSTICLLVLGFSFDSIACDGNARCQCNILEKKSLNTSEVDNITCDRTARCCCPSCNAMKLLNLNEFDSNLCEVELEENETEAEDSFRTYKNKEVSSARQGSPSMDLCSARQGSPSMDLCSVTEGDNDTGEASVLIGDLTIEDTEVATVRNGIRSTDLCSRTCATEEGSLQFELCATQETLRWELCSASDDCEGSLQF